MIVKDDYIVFPCPHCQELTLVFKNDINCGIFRHAVYKENLSQVNPHLPKKLCEYLAKNKLVFGCSKPIRIIENRGEYIVSKCDYM